MLQTPETTPVRRPRRRSEVKCPQSMPWVDIDAMYPSGIAKLRYGDWDRVRSRAKPRGAVGLQLFIALSDSEPADH